MVLPGGPVAEQPYAGPPNPAGLIYQDPHAVNTGPPLHGLDSTLPEGRTVYVSNVPVSITEAQLQDFFGVVGTVAKIKMCGEEQ